MSEEQVGRLFQRFTQADSSTSRQYGGTGLGLAISQRLVSLMGGEITVQSEPGFGSRFSFELDLPASSDVPVGDLPHISREARILVVDDSAANRDLIGLLLQQLGLQFETARDGAEAVAALGLSAFDLVLMDRQMPVMDGLEATRVIRQASLAQQPTIVGLTADAAPRSRLLCLEAGMQDCFTKPIELTEFARALERWLDDGDWERCQVNDAKPVVKRAPRHRRL